jgi:hypothetical protein
MAQPTIARIKAILELREEGVPEGQVLAMISKLFMDEFFEVLKEHGHSFSFTAGCGGPPPVRERLVVELDRSQYSLDVRSICPTCHKPIATGFDEEERDFEFRLCWGRCRGH